MPWNIEDEVMELDIIPPSQTVCVTNGAVQLSLGMINGLGKTFSSKTETQHKEIFASLLQSPAIYSDATVGRVNGKGKAVIVCTNGKEVLYFFRNQKGHEGIKGTPIEMYQQTLIHDDHDKTYYAYGGNHNGIRIIKQHHAFEEGSFGAVLFVYWLGCEM